VGIIFFIFTFTAREKSLCLEQKMRRRLEPATHLTASPSLCLGLATSLFGNSNNNSIVLIINAKIALIYRHAYKIGYGFLCVYSWKKAGNPQM